MRSTRKIMVEKEITTYICDFCTFSTENNTGCCGVAPIMICEICKKDVCREHRHSFWEDPGSDRHDIMVCKDCYPRFNECWEWAMENAPRYETVEDVALEMFKKRQ